MLTSDSLTEPRRDREGGARGKDGCAVRHTPDTARPRALRPGPSAPVPHHPAQPGTAMSGRSDHVTQQGPVNRVRSFSGRILFPCVPGPSANSRVVPLPGERSRPCPKPRASHPLISVNSALMRWGVWPPLCQRGARNTEGADLACPTWARPGKGID